MMEMRDILEEFILILNEIDKNDKIDNENINNLLINV